MPKAVEEAKKELGMFAQKWIGKTAFLDSFAKEVKSLLIHVNTLENQADELKAIKVKTAEQVEKLKAELAERFDSSQHTIDNLHAKVSEERVDLAEQKRRLEVKERELNNKLREADRLIVKRAQEKDLAAVKGKGN